jgi:hypothetical protein
MLELFRNLKTKDRQMRITEILAEAWSQKYKSSINCSHPKGFSQKAHCAGKKKHNESADMEMVCESCGMCETHGNITEIKKGQKDANGVTKCWPGKHAEGTKKGKTGGQVRNCVPNESVTEATGDKSFDSMMGNIVKGARYKGAAADQRADAAYGSMMNNITKNAADVAKPSSDSKFEQVYSAIERTLLNSHVHSEIDYDIMDALKKLKIKATDKLVQKLESTLVSRVSDVLKFYDESDLEEQGVTEGLHEQFDLIEEMVESLAEEHGVDADEIWEDFESVDDSELLETAAWRRKEGKSKKGGLNAKGVASYRRENPGSKLQTAVTTKPSKLKPGSKAAKRRKSFCARMGGVKGPMKKPNGKPTRKALALRKWNC